MMHSMQPCGTLGSFGLGSSCAAELLAELVSVASGAAQDAAAAAAGQLAELVSAA